MTDGTLLVPIHLTYVPFLLQKHLQILDGFWFFFCVLAGSSEKLPLL